MVDKAQLERHQNFFSGVMRWTTWAIVLTVILLGAMRLFLV